MKSSFEYREPSYLEFKRRRRCDFPKIQVPNIRRDVEEVRRLMKRLPTADLDEGVSCCICRSEDHLHFDCPCLDKVEDNVVLGPYHDFICLGCGKIGEICCSKGAFADSKLCVGCMAYGHWYWERKCMRGDVRRWAVPLPSIDGVQPPPTPHDNYESEGELVYDGGCFDSNEPTDKDNIQSKDEDTLIEGSEGSSGGKTYLKSESEGSQRMMGKRQKRSRKSKKHGSRKNIVGGVRKLRV